VADWHNRSHLGRTHVDEGVLRFFRDHMGCRSLLDVGCGPGGQCDAAKSLGYDDIVGVDGDPDVGATITHDFLEGPLHFAPSVFFDLAWCNEFLEHLPEEHAPNALVTLSRANLVAATAHPPSGRNIPHHHNERPAEYWIAKFEDEGFKYDTMLTQAAKEASTMQRDFFRDNGMVFVWP